MILGLLVAAWMCFGRKADPRLSALVIFILSALSMSMVFLVHADLSDDRDSLDCRDLNVIERKLFRGLLKQIDQWFPQQAPTESVSCRAGWWH